MSFFSKSKKIAEESGLLRGFLNRDSEENGQKSKLIGTLANRFTQQIEPAYTRPKAPSASTAYGTVSAANAPFGVSWGPKMPAEENQFNYMGNYRDYFERIFRAEFPAYRIERIDERYGEPTTFLFWSGARKALAVDLLRCSSKWKKTRRMCEAEGIPYLRYYVDHDGWWNTRTYVTNRTRAALEGRL